MCPRNQARHRTEASRPGPGRRAATGIIVDRRRRSHALDRSAERDAVRNITVPPVESADMPRPGTGCDHGGSEDHTQELGAGPHLQHRVGKKRQTTSSLTGRTHRPRRWPSGENRPGNVTEHRPVRRHARHVLVVGTTLDVETVFEPGTSLNVRTTPTVDDEHEPARGRRTSRWRRVCVGGRAAPTNRLGDPCR